MPGRLTDNAQTYGGSGVLVLDKPTGISSFAVVQTVRRLSRQRKVGHTGTLDPLATGVLPLCLGAATKIADLLIQDDKAYAGEALLGVRTDTLDITGRVLERCAPEGVTAEALTHALRVLQGEVSQIPPAFSAIHVDGKRAYARARRGETVALPPRTVRIERFALVDFFSPKFRFMVACSKGTYVRALVRDLGEAVGCGATLTALRRTRSGQFDLSQALTLEHLALHVDEGELPLISLDEALAGVPAREVSAADVGRVASGQSIACDGPNSPRVRICAGGRTIALGAVQDRQLRPRRVFPWALDSSLELSAAGHG